MDSLQNSFTALQEKNFNSRVIHGAWCPTMDLLALSTDDGQLAVHRLEWQRLWVTCPDSPVTALCWRPDGKVLVTGHADGSVVLYKVEQGEVHHRAKEHSSPITHLSWVEAAATPIRTPSGQAFAYRHTRFFAPPDAIKSDGRAPGSSVDGPLGSSKADAAAASSSEWPSVPEVLDVLVSSDASGCVRCSAFGQLLVAQLQLHAQASSQEQLIENIASLQQIVHGPGQMATGAASAPMQVQASVPGADANGSSTELPQAYLTRDLAHIIALSAPPRHATSSTQQAPGPGALVLSLHSTAGLSKSQDELARISVLLGLLAQNTSSAVSGLVSAAKEWRSGQDEMDKRLEALHEALNAHGGDGADWLGHLTIMLAAGHVGSGMQAFLTATLTEPGLRRLARALDNAVQQVTTTLLEAVLPALHLSTFLLGELRGQAAAAHISGALCLPAACLEAAERAAACAGVQAERLRLLAVRVGVQYRALFAWLLRVLQQLDDSARAADDPAAAAPASASAPLAGVSLDAVLSLLEPEGQLVADALRNDLEGAAACKWLGLPVASLSALQDSAVGPALQELQALLLGPMGQPHPDSACYALLALAEDDSAEDVTSLSMRMLAQAAGHVSMAGAAAAGISFSTIADLTAAGMFNTTATAAMPTDTQWPAVPLRDALTRLHAYCKDMQGALSQRVSPTMTTLLRMPLLPTSMGVSISNPYVSSHINSVGPGLDPIPAGSVTAPLKPSAISAGISAPNTTALPLCCVRLPQLKQEGPIGAALVAVHLPAGSLSSFQQDRPMGQSASGGEAVLLTMLAPQMAAGSCSSSSGHAMLRACVLQLPHRAVLVSMAAYKGAQLAIALAPASSTEHGASSSSSSMVGSRGFVQEQEPGATCSQLALVGTSALPWCVVDGASHSDGVLPGPHLLEMCMSKGAVVDWSRSETIRSRAPPTSTAFWQAPLLVSPARGVAAALVQGGRALMLDLEEDEEAGEDEGSEDEESAVKEADGEVAGRGSAFNTPMAERSDLSDMSV